MPLTELVTFKVTKEMRDKMKKYDNINWSALLRTHITNKIEKLEEIERVSLVNFCHRCGKRLESPEDNFCRYCGSSIPKIAPIPR